MKYNYALIYYFCSYADIISIKILNTGAWSSRTSERITVSLPMELEDFIPEVEDFYKLKHGGRKLQWYHHMSNGLVCIFINIYLKFYKTPILSVC